MRLRVTIGTLALLAVVLIAVSPPPADATELAGYGDCKGWTLDNSLWHVEMTVTASTDPAIAGTVPGNSVRFFSSPFDGTNPTATVTVVFGDGSIDTETLFRDVTECTSTTTTVTTIVPPTTTTIPPTTSTVPPTSTTTTTVGPTTTTATTVPPSTTTTTASPTTSTSSTTSTTSAPPTTETSTVPPTTVTPTTHIDTTNPPETLPVTGADVGDVGIGGGILLLLGLAVLGWIKLTAIEETP